MKKFFYSLFLFTATLGFAACGGSDDPEPTPEPDPTPTPTPTPDPTPTTDHEATSAFMRGADISWYTEMRDGGKKFYNADGTERTCPVLMKEIGMNMVRLRVWVKPSNRGCAYSDVNDVMQKAVDAYKAGLNVMIDFHLSDWWADPSRQDMPGEWADLSHEELKAAVAKHVTEVLESIQSQGAEVAWVQIGNETRNGMMHDDGRWWNDNGDIDSGRQRFAELYNAGYDAVKAIFPNAKVMPHLNHAYEDNDWWFKQFKAAGGKMDMIALSHYPQSDNSNMTWSDLNSTAISRIRSLAQTYGVPVLVVEFGVKQSDITTGAQIAADFMEKAKALGTSTCAGVIYWEPEVYGSWKPESYTSYGWSAYDMGAFTSSGRPSAILDAWSE